MKHDIVLAGVGGQGILTIARGLSNAALRKGLNVKQAEVHGMSQRGGAVYANVRISHDEIYSDIIAPGQAGMILSIEPMEALRYATYLAEDGVIIVNTNAVTNIPNYPPIEQVLEAVARHPNHVLLDMERLARAAGSILAANIVAIGAASLYLDFSIEDFEAEIEAMFARKGERVVAVNLKAFHLGRNAAQAYLEALNRGATPRSSRQWLDSLTPDDLQAPHLDPSGALVAEDAERLTGAEATAFERILLEAYEEGRMQLFEHEVYRLIELVGAISPPRHVFVAKDALITQEALDQFHGDKVVLKLVSPTVVHKSDVKAVAFVPKTLDAVRREMTAMIERHIRTADVAGVLAVEFVEGARGLGGELFVGIRATREFGPVIAAGLGGVETEFLAQRMRQGQAVAKAVATETSAEEFFAMFQATAAHDLLAGNVRGHERSVSDGELIRCFRAFISIARRFCIDRGEEGPDIAELEVNPFAFRHQRLVPLDGLARLKPATKARLSRPASKVEKLLEPKTMAIVGVSATSENFGRIILKNVLRAGYDPEALTVIHERESAIEGVTCAPSIEQVSRPIDLLVIAAPNHTVPAIVEQANASGKVASGIIISAGFAESEAAGDLAQQVEDAIRVGRESGNGAVFLGPNCMGVQSKPGRYDTFFIPEAKLGPVPPGPDSPVALISQSGAFVISRVNHLPHLKPRFSVTLGNQADVTVSDMVDVLRGRSDIDVIGVYLEGFADLDGAAFVRAIKDARDAGKQIVFYKGGKTDSGRQAAAGHTASVAGDYDICLAAVEAAGAIVAEDFQEFEALLELAALLREKKPGQGRIFAMTNAGMEAVALADAVTKASGHGLSLPETLTDPLGAILEQRGLAQLVSPRNPLDLTPMAGEPAYESVLRTALECPGVDAVIVSCVPLTPQLKTVEGEIEQGGSLADIVPEIAAGSDKPIVFVLDAGPPYDAMANLIRSRGVPVFRTADAAGRALARYLGRTAEKETVQAELAAV